MIRGYDPGGIDGRLGDHTRTALRSFQTAQGLPASGYLDLSTLDALEITTADPSLGAAPAPAPAAPEAAPLQTPAAEPPTPTEPAWLDQPTSADLERLRPRGADARLESGAVLRCRVLDDGVLTACVTLSETPPGRRYGQAAMRAAGLYRMRVDGPYAPFVGQEITIAIRWPRP